MFWYRLTWVVLEKAVKQAFIHSFTLTSCLPAAKRLFLVPTAVHRENLAHGIHQLLQVILHSQTHIHTHYQCCVTLSSLLVVSKLCGRHHNMPQQVEL